MSRRKKITTSAKDAGWQALTESVMALLPTFSREEAYRVVLQLRREREEIAVASKMPDTRSYLESLNNIGEIS